MRGRFRTQVLNAEVHERYFSLNVPQICVTLLPLVASSLVISTLMCFIQTWSSGIHLNWCLTSEVNKSSWYIQNGFLSVASHSLLSSYVCF